LSFCKALQENVLFELDAIEGGQHLSLGNVGGA